MYFEIENSTQCNVLFQSLHISPRAQKRKTPPLWAALRSSLCFHSNVLHCLIWPLESSALQAQEGISLIYNMLPNLLLSSKLGVVVCVMKYQHFDLHSLSSSSSERSVVRDAKSPLLWTQYPLLFLDRRSIKMRLCFILLPCFWCSERKLSFFGSCYYAITSATVSQWNWAYNCKIQSRGGYKVHGFLSHLLVQVLKTCLMYFWVYYL